jgi:DNA mismatch repair protein MLH1
LLIDVIDRLVDSSKIKKAIDSLYTAYLPKGASPWVYLSLEIDPAKVDVNVHPTKSDVHFLNEDEMVEAIVGAVQTALVSANTSRSFNVQILLPGAPDPSDKAGESSIVRSKSAPNYKVRMDPTNRTLNSMFAVSDPSQLSAFATSHALDERPPKRRNAAEDDGVILELDEDEHGVEDEEEDALAAVPTTMDKMGREISESLCDFSSILDLRRLARKKGNLGELYVERRDEAD